MNKKISIIIIDDHPLIRGGFASLIKEDENLELIGEASNGVNVLELISRLKPDVVVIDIELPDMLGLNIAKKVSKEYPNTSIVILTGRDNEEYFSEAMHIGVSGYFLKDETDDLVSSLKRIHDGDTLLSPKVHKYVIKRYRKRSELAQEKPNIENLTPREKEVLKSISENKSSQEISNELNIDRKTVETHRNKLREKLGLIGKDRNALLVFALKNKSYLPN